MKKYILFLIPLLLFSCDRFFEFGGEEILDGFDNQLNDDKLVIEALITDVDTIQAIKLSQDINLKSENTIPVVSEALVQVSTDKETYIFEYVDSLMAFVANFRGIPNVDYHMEVKWKNKTYTAQAEMADLQQFDIDSIEIRKAVFDINHWRWFDPNAPFREEFKDDTIRSRKEILITKDDNYEYTDTLPGGKIITHNTIYINPKDDGFLEGYKYGDLAEFWFGPDPYIINAAEKGKVINVYKIYLYAKESKVERNYYRFDVKRFGRSWLQPGQIIVADDYAVKENISGIEFPGYFVPGDEVEFFMYGISKEAYNYYTSLLNTIQNDGGGFSPPPGNPVTNIHDEEGMPGLGFFEVARVAKLKKIVPGN